MTTIPNGSPYENILENYLGTTYADQQVGFVTQKDVLWSNFLAQNGLSPTDPLVTSHDPSVLIKFMAFVQGTYNSLQVATNLSPDEIARRKLMFSVYDLIVIMLETLQKNVGVVGDNVVFLNKYQQAYSNMMAAVPGAIEIGGARSLPTPNTADLSQWTLGFAGITMNDYISTAVQNGLQGTSVTTQIHSVNSLVPLPASNVQQTATGVIKDALTATPQSQLVAAGPLTNTVYPTSVPSDSLNTLSFSSTPTSVTFTYNYKQQYDFEVTNYTYQRDGSGNIVYDNHGNPQFNKVGTVHYSGWYDVPPVTQTVNFTAADSAQTRLNLTKAAFTTFLNIPLDNFANIPHVYADYPKMEFDTSSYTNTYPGPIGYTDRGISVLASMTQPVTIYNASNIKDKATISVVRNITTAWDPLYNMVHTATTDSRQAAREAAASRKRGQVNSLLQQYITDSQSKQQILSNQADAENSQQNQAQTGFNQGASLLSTIIGQLSTIITSIFQTAS